jgi:hypothetical protein
LVFVDKAEVPVIVCKSEGTTALIKTFYPRVLAPKVEKGNICFGNEPELRYQEVCDLISLVSSQELPFVIVHNGAHYHGLSLPPNFAAVLQGQLKDLIFAFYVDVMKTNFPCEDEALWNQLIGGKRKAETQEINLLTPMKSSSSSNAPPPKRRRGYMVPEEVLQELQKLLADQKAKANVLMDFTSSVSQEAAGITEEIVRDMEKLSDSIVGVMEQGEMEF